MKWLDKILEDAPPEVRVGWSFYSLLWAMFIPVRKAKRHLRLVK